MRGAVLAGVLLAGVVSADHIRIETRTDVRGMIERAERRSDYFKDYFEEAIDESSLNRTNEERRLRDRFKVIEQALDRLRKKAKEPADPRSEVARALAAASDINRVIDQGLLGTSIQRGWETFRNDLNALAQFYKVNAVN